MVGIYPSLFDNFPYVCLEGMAVGLHVVGSKNSGMVEMLEDPDSIYDTGDFNDLAFKIIKKIKLAQRESVNKRNIDRVKTEYNPKKRRFIGNRKIILVERENLGIPNDALLGRKGGKYALFYVEGDVYKKLGDIENAEKLFRKSTEIDPNYIYGVLSVGILYYDNAVDLQEKANAEKHRRARVAGYIDAFSGIGQKRQGPRCAAQQ